MFHNAAENLREGDVGGGTMIFQGAPGAGKSALMLECMEAVRQHSTPQEPWVPVSIAPGDLNSSTDVMLALVVAADKESQRLSKLSLDSPKLKYLMNRVKRVYDELSQRGFSLAGVSVGAKNQAKDDSKVSPAKLFGNAAPLLEGIRFVVFVDEAQNIPVETTTKAVLDCLHRDPQGLSLVAAFFGLSNTEGVLEECGLSRLGHGRIVNLESLTLADAGTSFRRMLNAYYTGSEAEKETWSNALAELSQGWPQHINAIGVAAGEVVRRNGGQLERNLLDKALAQGIEAKHHYYARRLNAGKCPPWVYRQIALEAAKKQGELAGTVTYEEVYDLTEAVRRMQAQNIDEFISMALCAGLLAPVKNLPFHYRFPIPSLGDYLRALPVDPPDCA